MVEPIRQAMIALMISPGINENENKNALEIGICVIKPITIVPTISNNNTPKRSVGTINTRKLILCLYASLTEPIA